MKLTEQMVVEEMHRVGFGGELVQRAARNLVERARLSPVELANAADRVCTAAGHKPYKLDEQRDKVEQLLRELAG